FIDAIRNIEPGEELTYDYQIQREPDDPPDIDAIFACHCGKPGCRGTMMWPPRRARRAPRAARAPRSSCTSRAAALTA
ncbi:MAG TPA: SET domain-containing protein-lysine N-methyltransferase, partial [Candidatus Dormibacteraeota bacterium]|nr:SET domain-containing protein-lysine N-methyltransferase [Candidatus Dormibacteraeota bacterium]